MCKYSLTESTRDAKKGEYLEIGTAKTSHAPAQTHGVFHQKGGATACASCVKDGTTLTLIGVPIELQEQFKIGSTEVVTMVDKGHQAVDLLTLSTTSATVPLIAFANKGVSAYVGELERPRIGEPKGEESPRVTGRLEVVR